MKTTMKPQEIANRMEGICRITESEDKFREAKSEAKFPPKVAMAIAKNRKILEDEFRFIQEQQKKNEEIAEQKNIELKDVPEQMELLRSDIEIEIHTISADDLNKCKEMTSADYYDLMFMVEQN